MRLTKILIAALALSLSLEASSTYSHSDVRLEPDPRYTKPDFAYKWPHVTLEQAKGLLNQPGVVFADGRSFSEWQEAHIPGAIPMPGTEFDKRYASKKKALRRAKVIVCYCHGENCGLADYLAQLLSDKGHRNIAVFWGGYPAWLKAKLPLEKGAKPKP